jgi:hypothetical protein|tara:strand:+ start:4523 stop:5659 length:1137 start_codon:yes stop_codon:yes gene_type:complete
MSHLLEEYAKNLGVKSSKPIVVGHFFPLLQDKYITISTEKDNQAKSYKHYNIALDLLRPILDAHDIKIFQIDGAFITGVDAALNLTFKQQYFTLSNSLLHLGSAGVLSHAASALGVPTVNLFGDTFPTINRPLFSAKKNNINLAPKWKNKPCLSTHDPQQEINNIAPETVAQSTLDLLKIDGDIYFKTLHQGQNFGAPVAEIIPTVFNALQIPENHEVVLRLDYGCVESTFLEYCRRHKLSIISDKLIQPHGLQGVSANIQRLCIIIDTSWDTIPENYFKVLKSQNIQVVLLVKNKKQLSSLRNKYFDLPVELFEEEVEKPKGVFSDACFFTNKRLIEGDKEYLSYAHWKKNLDNDNQVIDSADYWRESPYFYIYEQN